MDAPVVERVITFVARHEAAFPTPYTPRAVMQSGTSKSKSSPLNDSRSEQFIGKVTVHEPAVEVAAGQAVATTVVVGVVLGPRAASRQETILNPVVVLIMSVVERQISADSTAKGPRARVQAGMLAIRARPFSVLRSVDAAGSDEI